ncbi:Protein of unknown function [Caminicella sporogenes DSM 14501]|uniref:DUF3793 family protein n=1 Tax=Caminicella sporogenes DSM 14501 TaxID=1121266 RepID=A0A1M6PS13_9FIRM|nr:DUF3793 family protein [Caminicella sporogenes]RKD22000.1 hypothetical protein BET04_07050 [Caminicella sporogenes]WIF96039.1 DUF3793 family protein [Caminicella sporogenes]SHK10671.1 Protein of unknown function [Caminicella sporogenes DSM 14501]
MNKCTETCILSYKKNDDFIGRIVGILGPVLMGSKPSELLSFRKNDKNLLDKIENIKKYIGKCKRIKYKLFEFKNESIKILFYNPKVLDKNLKEYRNMKFLKSIGYPEEYDLELYIQFIVDKMKEGVIPHEIGVFLGYPLKDIIGFIGHPSLRLTKINGWRVYGDPKISDIKFNEFLEAKKEIKRLLRFNKVEEILLSM